MTTSNTVGITSESVRIGFFFKSFTQVLTKKVRGPTRIQSLSTVKRRFPAGKINAIADLALADIQDPTLKGEIAIFVSDDGVDWQLAASSTWEGGAVNRFGNPSPPHIGIKVSRPLMYRTEIQMNKRVSYGCQIGIR